MEWGVSCYRAHIPLRLDMRGQTHPFFPSLLYFSGQQCRTSIWPVGSSSSIRRAHSSPIKPLYSLALTHPKLGPICGTWSFFSSAMVLRSISALAEDSSYSNHLDPWWLHR
jgi:hypothetical protein